LVFTTLPRLAPYFFVGKVVLYQLSYFRINFNLVFTTLPRLAPYFLGARLCSTN